MASNRPSRDKLPWTAAEDAYIRTHYRKRSAERIGKELGRTKIAIVARTTKLKCSASFYWNKEQDEFLRTHADNGWEWCAKKLGRTTIAVYNRVRKIGIQLKMLKAGDLERIRELHAEGLVCREIGERLGVSDECVRRWLNHWNLPHNKRDEAARVVTLKRNLLAKYGVSTVAHARKVRKRRLARAALTVDLQGLGDSLAGQLQKAGGRSCRN